MASIEEANKIANELAEEFLNDVLSMSGKDFVRKYMMQDVGMEIVSFPDQIIVREIKIPLMRLEYNAWFNSEISAIDIYDISFQVRTSAKIDPSCTDEVLDFINEKVVPEYFKMVADNINDEEDE